jgi:urease accessory protein
MKIGIRPALILSLVMLPAIAEAHPGHGVAVGFWPGVNHPLSGFDHILAMVAVGIWAAQLGGRYLWAVPLSFVSLMAVGGVLGVAGIPVPYVEQGIIMSILILGLMIVASVRLPLWASCGIVGLFALCHGHAHGAEMPLSASGLSYGAGFIVATTCLHLTGIGLGIALEKLAHVQLVRLAGAAIVMCGVYLACG